MNVNNWSARTPWAGGQWGSMLLPPPTVWTMPKWTDDAWESMPPVEWHRIRPPTLPVKPLPAIDWSATSFVPDVPVPARPRRRRRRPEEVVVDDRQRAFVDAILAHPGEAGPLGVYADFLEEEGLATFAFAYRWAAAWGRWPRVSPKGKSVVWHRGAPHSHSWATARPEFLPRHVFCYLGVGASVNDRWQCGSVPTAFAHLAKALAVLRTTLALPEVQS